MTAPDGAPEETPEDSEPPRALGTFSTEEIFGALTKYTPSEEIRVMLATARDQWPGELLDLRLNLQRLLQAKGLPSPGRMLDSVFRDAPVRKLHSKPGQIQLKGLSPSLAECCRVLEHPEARALVLGEGRLRFNEMLQVPEFNGEEVEETRALEFMRDAERRVFGSDPKTGDNRIVTFSAQTARSAFLVTSKLDSYHPVREWLKTLAKPPDGVIEQMAREALGLTGLSAKLLRLWMIGACARVMDPGCELQTAIVLLAPGGGEHKSRFLRLLAGSKWMSDTHLDMTGFNRKDAYLQMHRVWIYEVPELESAHTESQRSRTKSFITSPVDTYRAPYEPTVRSHDRMFALAATRNPRNFLACDDPAFNRRFWPLEIKGQIDLDAIAVMREDAWAEAYHAYLSKEKWHLTDESELATLRETHDQFSHHDAAESTLQVFLSVPHRARKALWLSDIMRCCFNLPIEKQLDTRTQGTVVALLRACKWEEKRRRWVSGREPSTRWVDSSHRGRGRVGAVEGAQMWDPELYDEP